MFHSHQDEIDERERRQEEIKEDKAWDFLVTHQPQDAVRAIKGEIRAVEDVRSRDEIDFLMEDAFFHLEMEPPPPEAFGFNPYADDDTPLGIMPPAMQMIAAGGMSWDDIQGHEDDADFDPQPYLMRNMPYE